MLKPSQSIKYRLANATFFLLCGISCGIAFGFTEARHNEFIAGQRLWGDPADYLVNIWEILEDEDCPALLRYNRRKIRADNLNHPSDIEAGQPNSRLPASRFLLPLLIVLIGMDSIFAGCSLPKYTEPKAVAHLHEKNSAHFNDSPNNYYSAIAHYQTPHRILIDVGSSTASLGLTLCAFL